MPTISMSLVGRCRGRPLLPLRAPPVARVHGDADVRPGPAPARRLCRRRTWRPACPWPGSSRMSFSSRSGVAWARKFVDAGLGGDWPRRSSGCRRDHDRAHGHLRSSAKRFRGCRLVTMSLRWMTPRQPAVLDDRERRAPGLAAMPSANGGQLPRRRLLAQRILDHDSTAPLRMELPATSTPLMRVCGREGDERACSGAISRPRMPVLLLGEHDDGAALRRIVAEAGQLAASASCGRSRPAAE